MHTLSYIGLTFKKLGNRTGIWHLTACINFGIVNLLNDVYIMWSHEPK